MRLFSSRLSAALVLADGSVFKGTAIGHHSGSVGEVVFNTAMTGYQEILTDPSYHGQIVTMTYPHIGNTGTNDQDIESVGHFASGLVIRDLQQAASWRSVSSLDDYLNEHHITAIADVDTRALTRHLRTHGAQAGCIVHQKESEEPNLDGARKTASAFPGLSGLDLARIVTTKQTYSWTEGLWQLSGGFEQPDVASLPYHVVAYDYGIKRNILRLLVAHGCRVTVVPAKTTAEEVLALRPDGVVLSNGPGDPAPCDYAITAIQKLLASKVPILGICLGHQLLALASGAKTIKMKFGHHGANHPVKELDSGKVFITSQNHGFAVDPQNLPPHLKVTHVSLFDGSIQGLRRTDTAAFSFQGHPEASPGPHDLGQLFEQFVRSMQSVAL